MTTPAPTGPAAGAPAPQPSITVTASLWRLQADPASIDDAAREWRRVGRRVRDVSDDINKPADRLVGSGWLGETAETFDQHRRTLLRDVYAEGDLAEFAAARLEHAAAALRSAQNLLTEAWSGLVARVPASTSRRSGRVIFRPADHADSVFVHRTIKEANAVREELDDMLLDDVIGLERVRREWQVIGTALTSVAKGTSQAFVLPPEATGTTVIRDGNTVVVNTGTGHDKVEVGVNPATGEQIVVVNGVATTYPPGTNIVIRTGEGDDEVVVAPGAKSNVTLLGGAGNDQVLGGSGDETILGGAGRDTLLAGGGDDRVSGGTGEDYIDGSGGDDILDGGLDNDNLYGMDGDDEIAGGEGMDIMNDGTGDDQMEGGGGDDLMFGDRGEDQIRGDAGDDVIIGGPGRDTVYGGSGYDTAYHEDKEEGEVDQLVPVEWSNVGTPKRIP